MSCIFHLSFSIALLAIVMLTACSPEPKPRRQDPRRPNPPSEGVIDTPVLDESVGPTIDVTGWVIDESGVQRVRIYIDHRLAASVPLTQSRPDVAKVFPRFTRPGAIHGWTARIDFGEQLGPCTIRAEALDGRGALTQFAYVNVRIEP